MKKNKIIGIALCMALLFSFSACSPKTDDVPDKPGIDEPEKPVLPPVETTETINPLTGEASDMSATRASRKPVAVMLGNSSDAQPQEGVSTADIWVELMAEGSTTRIMGIWQDTENITKIGSVRSSRPYFIDMAQWVDAFYLHFGASVPAYEALKSRKDLVSFDGIYDNKLFTRDAERRKKMALEHTAITTGARIEETLATIENTQKKDAERTAFNFDTEHSAKNGQSAAKIGIGFFSLNKPSFAYDETSGHYVRSQYKKEHYDATYDALVTPKNVIVLFMKTAPVKNSELHLVTVDSVGGGTGMYFSDGKYVDIKWSKPQYDAPLTLTMADGSPLLVNPGSTFIECVNTGSDVTVE